MATPLGNFNGNSYGLQEVEFSDISVNYRILGRMFGLSFLQEKLQDCEMIENYEECKLVKDAIDTLESKQTK